MKTILFYCLFVAILNPVSVFSKDMKLGKPLLNNSDFHRKKIEYWKAFNGRVDSVKLARLIAGYSQALRFRPLKKQAKLIYQEDFFVTPGMAYELSFIYRSKGNPLKVSLVIGGKEHSLDLAVSKKWKRYKNIIPVSSQSRSGGILQFQYDKVKKGDEILITAVSLVLKKCKELLSAKECFAKLAASLKKQGWQTSETPKEYILSRGGVRKYYKKMDGLFSLKNWYIKAYLGQETDEVTYSLDKIPLGFIVYMGQLNGSATRQGIPWKKLAERMFSDLSKKNVSTLVITPGGRLMSKEKDEHDGIQFLLDTAKQYNMKVILQPSSLYLRLRKGVNKKTDIKKTKRLWPKKIKKSSKLFEKFDAHPALLAWSFKEEVQPGDTKLLSEYYAMFRKAGCKSPIFLCNNQITSANKTIKPEPQILAFDRYTYKYITYLGLLPTPLKSMQMLVKSANAFLQAAVSTGRPLIHVGLTDQNYCRQLLESKRIIRDPKAGWKKNAEGGWDTTIYYFPPKNGMRAQIWCAIAAGAKGFIGWFYNYPAGDNTRKFKPPHPRSVEGTHFGIGCNRFGQEPPELEEIGATFGDIKKLEKYILNMNRRVFPKASATDKNTFVFTHQIMKSNEYILAVVNTKIGTNNKKTGIYIDSKTARLQGVDPVGARRVEILLKDKSAVFDLKNNKSLTVNDKKVFITLGPGEGTLLLLGNKDDADKLRENLENNKK